MNRYLLVVGVVMLLAGLFVAIMFQVSPTKLMGFAIAFFGFVIMVGSTLLNGRETLHPIARAFLILVWLVVSFAIAFIAALFFMDMFVMNIIFDATLTFVSGWGLVFILFSIFQLLMYKSGLLSSRRTKSYMPKETPTGMGVLSKLGGSKSLEKGEFSGVVQNLKRERDLTFFSLMVSGASKPTFYWVEANIDGLALNEGDSVWLKGELGKDGTLRTADVRNLSAGPAVLSGSETSPQGPKTTGPVIGEMGKRNCPMCGGTGSQKIMQWKTVMEQQTVYEQVTQFQFGKPVKVTVPRTIQKAVQKPDYKMVPCNTCKGTGKV